MTRLLLPLLLVCVQAEPAPRLEVLQTRMNALMDELHPRVSRLEVLADSYSPDADFESLARERGALREEILPKLQELEEANSLYRRRLGPTDATALAVAFLDAKLKAVPLASSPGIAGAHERRMLAERCGRFLEGARGTLSKEAEAFQSFSEARETRSLARTLALVLGAVATGLIALALWPQRQRILRPLGVPAQALRPLLAVQPHAPSPSASGERTAPPPSVVKDAWKIGRSLGAEQLGEAFEAEGLLGGRRAVLRRLRPELLCPGSGIEELAQEARRWGTLKHPHILELFDVLREGGECWLAVAPDRGAPLSAQLGEDRRIGLGPARTLGLQLCAALSCAHGRGILHRDLKPAHIWIAPGGTARLADFGVSYLARKAVSRSVRGEEWGSGPYMGAEHGLGVLSPESDVFSVGAVLYEALTGLKAFPGPDFEEQKRAMLFPLPSDVAKNLPVEADTLLLKALRPEPKDRHRSAEELAAALEALPAA